MAYYSAGYLIVEKRDREEWMDDKILPTKVVSASSCICDSYPDAWGFDWFTESHDNAVIDKVKDKLNLDGKSFSKLRKWVKKEEKARHVEFPNVFLDLDTAREFYRKFLQHIPNLELIGMGFSKETIGKVRKDEKRDQMWQDAWSKFFSENPDAMAFDPEFHEGYFPDESSFEMKEEVFLGILSRFEPIDPSGIILGFEILGDEGCFNFHSHICNSLETKLREELGVTFNENGFIDSYEDAVRSTRYIERGEIGEPVDWYPCQIVRYEFP